MSLDSRSSVTDPEDGELLAAERDLLRGENERLRRALTDAHRTRHRRAALVLVALSVVALLGAFVFPDERTLLLAIGSTGLFGATLIRFLTTERFISADIGEHVYRGLVADQESIVAELGLQDVWVYVPTGGTHGVRLFVPQHAEYALPSGIELGSTFVVTDDAHRRGATFDPTGRGLLAELEATIAGEPSDDPAVLAEQIADGVVESFELARTATTSVDPAAGRATIAITDSAYGSVDQFDHPIASLFATAFATVLDEPVTLEVDADDGSTEQFVTCTWTVPSDD